MSFTGPAQGGTAPRGTASGGETLVTGGGCSGLGAVTSCTDTGLTNGQVYGNPGFENGTNAVPWSGVISNDGSEPPHTGSWDAWLDGYGTTHTDQLPQSLTLPTGCSTCNLSFWLHIDTAETSTTTAYDKLTVQVLNSSGSTTGLTASPQGRGLRNLGSNAIRHTPGDGIIDVLAEVLRPPGHPGRRLGRPVPGHHRPLTTAAEFAGTASDRSSWQDARNLRAA